MTCGQTKEVYLFSFDGPQVYVDIDSAMDAKVCVVVRHDYGLCTSLTLLCCVIVCSWLPRGATDRVVGTAQEPVQQLHGTEGRPL